jgi:hypothetical protein
VTIGWWLFTGWTVLWIVFVIWIVVRGWIIAGKPPFIAWITDTSEG